MLPSCEWITIGVDYETYSDVNLKKHGKDLYGRSPNFKPLMLSAADDDAEWTYDFIMDPYAEEDFRSWTASVLKNPAVMLVAHNAGFERMVYHWFGMDLSDRIVDSAAVARMVGAGERLALASRQLTHAPKLDEGMEFIQTFCIPNEWNNYSCPTINKVLERSEQWLKGIQYCEVDAKGGKQILDFAIKLYAQFGANLVIEKEHKRELITQAQNDAGWPTDMELVAIMKRRNWVNNVIEQKKFFLDTNVQLNFGSHIQLKRYAKERGYTLKGTDKYQIPVALDDVEDKLKRGDYGPEGKQALEEVAAMLRCKMELGGTSLSKLQKIEDIISPDGRLRDQYVHAGAGQTFRTSGRGAQMQNLKKLDAEVRDMQTLYDFTVEWSNKDMEAQLRQIFMASHPDGELIVGDFSGVESRATAYEAGEEWKLKVFREGKDVYIALVNRFQAYQHLTYEQIADKNGEYYKLRPRGKYSELSCGYQASAVVLQDFMFRLGFTISLQEAAENVADWRYANPNIEKLWEDLSIMLKTTVQTGEVTRMTLAYGQEVTISPFYLESIQAQHPGAMSLMIQLWDKGEPIVNRVVHGCYMVGKAVAYYKTVENYTPGKPLWEKLNLTQTQKKKKDILNTIYGGKLLGILTQSLCRELFYDSMEILDGMLKHVPNAEMIGQFHDEIVVDWWPDPNGLSRDEVKELMAEAMSTCRLEGFPLTADIKSAYHYIK